MTGAAVPRWNSRSIGEPEGPSTCALITSRETPTHLKPLTESSMSPTSTIRLLPTGPPSLISFTRQHPYDVGSGWSSTIPTPVCTCCAA
eukprot:3133104-Rhodomonas_salina.1